MLLCRGTLDLALVLLERAGTVDGFCWFSFGLVTAPCAVFHVWPCRHAWFLLPTDDDPDRGSCGMVRFVRVQHEVGW